MQIPIQRRDNPACLMCFFTYCIMHNCLRKMTMKVSFATDMLNINLAKDWNVVVLRSETAKNCSNFRLVLVTRTGIGYVLILIRSLNNDKL